MISPTSDDRLLDAIRKLIALELGDLAYAGVWEYAIQVVGASTVQLAPSSSDTPFALPPVSFPFAAYTATGASPTVGATCLVAFVNRDPSKPVMVPRAGSLVLAGTIGTTGASGSIGLVYTDPGGTTHVIGTLTVGGGATIANVPATAGVTGRVGAE